METLSLDDIKKMKKAGKLAAQTLDHIGAFVEAGVSTDALDQEIHNFIIKNGAVPAPLNYRGFPKSSCISINDCICHGLPGDYLLKPSDVLNIDVTCIVEGFHGDTSRMYYVDASKAPASAPALVECAYDAMMKGIEAIHPKGHVGDIGFAINKLVTRRGYFAVLDIGGHGIGRKFHTDPFVPSFGKKGKGESLKPWTCITVEPMVNETATDKIEKSIPGSEVKYYLTQDGCLSAQFEHTILITDTGHEVLTLS